MDLIQQLGRSAALLTAMTAALMLAACDGGVSAASDRKGANATEDAAPQEVIGSKSVYGKARDRAEDVVEKQRQRQQEMLELMEPENQNTDG